jgi:hypothetical protein
MSSSENIIIITLTEGHSFDIKISDGRTFYIKHVQECLYQFSLLFLGIVNHILAPMVYVLNIFLKTFLYYDFFLIL